MSSATHVTEVVAGTGGTVQGSALSLSIPGRAARVFVASE